MGLLLWCFAYSGCEDRPSMQYIPQKNIKSATASFADSLLIVCYELSYPHFMERRGSLYFSSEHTAYSPAEGLRVGSCILINYLLNLVSNSREIRYVTSMRITPATTSYITCCFVVNVDMNTAIAQIQKVVRIHCGTFLLPRMPI